MVSTLSILFPQVRAEVLRLLFANTDSELHLRELTRRSGLTLGTMQDELARLLGAELVTSRRDGNRRYYRANTAHPLFPDLQQLVLKSVGPCEASTKLLPDAMHAKNEGNAAKIPASGWLAHTASVEAQSQNENTPRAHSVTLNEID